MKKGILLVITTLSLIIFTGCSSVEKDIDTNNISKSNQEEKNNDFESLNIVSSSIKKEDRDSYDEEVITTFEFTNNGEIPIKYLNLDFAYYDSEGTCISTDGRFSDVVVQPGKSVLVDTYSDVEGDKELVKEVKLIKYGYELTEENEQGLKEVYLNTETKEVE